jgi:quercetin dioxygenase-like cupin family protein
MLQLPGGVTARIHVTGADTGGAFVMVTDSAPPGWALPPHRHTRESETIHVTAGALWLDVAGDRRVLGPGDTAHVPAGTLHSGGTEGDTRVERVVIFSPAGMEDFFAVLAAGAEDVVALAEAHGWRFA